MPSKLVRVIDKKIGETPLQALERFRSEYPEYAHEPMTYAGRLDPMASGKLLLLVGEECKNKARYLGLDKTYEVEIVFGINTDSYDILGLPKLGVIKPINPADVSWSKYVGKFSQEYPAYSSKTVKGKQLHTLARDNELPEEMPTKEVEIYSIKVLGKRLIGTSELLDNYVNRINLVKGDFRQNEIKKTWVELLARLDCVLSVLTIKVECSSGTYMRSLADRIGKDLGLGAFALSIKRTKIGN